MFKRFFGGEEAASMTEYALLLALIAVLSIGVLTVLGTEVSTVFQDVVTAIP